ncbi:MAG: esterase [Bacteroidetes bacterium]|nr:esterase [Bacteroidota bacterium]
MNREHHEWTSSRLGRSMDLLVFGHSGAPVIVFPTSKGRFYEYEDRNMVSALSWHLDQGWIQLFCVDSADADSWYQYGAHPAHRAWMHNQYDEYIRNEVIPFIQVRNPNPYLTVTGCSFGGYHAVNFGFRHPDVVKRIISLGGIFSIRDYVMGWWDETCYFNSPVDYLPGIHGQQLDLIRQQKIILATGENDICRGYNESFVHQIYEKGIWYTFDNYPGAGHDWPWWQDWIRTYLAP